MKDILYRLANSSANESSHELQCRCFDAAEEISRLREIVRDLLVDMPIYECGNFHHAKKDRHSDSECPVFDRFTRAVERARNCMVTK